jgi:CheY-like chemotaxis protein/predicted regulator of Ras-like GTPase activity (Roadblock/LC7/MglB family)
MAKVLVVDDSVSVRKVVERALQARQISVVSASLGIEAIERIEKDEPDLVVCDVLLPDKDGYAVCEFVKTHPRLAGTPVLLMSGIVNDQVLERAARVHSNEVLRKPFAADELARRVGELLAQAPPRPEAPRRPAESPDATAPPPSVAATSVTELLGATPTMEPSRATAPPPAGPTRVLPEPAAPVIESPVSLPVLSAVSLPSVPALKGCLSQLTAVAGVRLAVVADREGFLVESVGDLGIEAEVASALAACLAESSDGLGREMGLGPLQGMILEFEKGMVLLHGVGDTAMLAIVLQDPAALGKVRYYVRKVLPELARAL